MKRFLTVILVILIQVNLFGIERYSKGDTLFNWSTKLNLRVRPSLESKIIAQIENGERIVVNQDKYFKGEDFQLENQEKNWERTVTGKWVEVVYKDKIGYVFDAYLSKYEIEQIKSDEIFETREELRIPDYEVYFRLSKKGGTVKESGIGIEWSKTIYYVPDLSIEEAIYLIKPDIIDSGYGKREWKFNLDKGEVEMSENDGISWRRIRIRKIETLCVIIIEDGV
ncbi:SH3 domain-containing protein [Phaeodactylibacter xiamenensis]|uniref:SH3 domain-containing protein n=1 Tax=Phaeodactylibacter xiamenensis TaxID=1524460 RepID=UPI003CCC12B3